MTYSINNTAKLFLCIGFAFMFYLQFIRIKKYNFTKNKALLAFLAIVFCSLLGSYIMFYIENQIWGGVSFYGTMLFGPILVYPFVKILKLNYTNLLAWVAPTGCITHVIMKFGCWISGCCGWADKYSRLSFMPLQLLEAASIFVIMIVLLYLENTKMSKKNIYPIYLISYGVCRFILNSFRKKLSIFIWMPAGHFWSLVAIMSGIVVLLINKLSSNK